MLIDRVIEISIYVYLLIDGLYITYLTVEWIIESSKKDKD